MKVCWHRSARPKVMDTVALHVEQWAFLATHYPCPVRRFNPETQESWTFDEDQFLEGLVDPDARDLIAVVTGDTGTGKSHLVRWLYEHLRVRQSREHLPWHIVLVPRESANLLDVVKRILHGCEDPDARKLESRLVRAETNLSEQGSMHRLLDSLALAIDPNAIQGPPAFMPQNALQEFVLKGLPDLLRGMRTELIRRGVQGGIVGRLAAHVSGHREMRPEDEGPLKWEKEDLDLPVANNKTTWGELLAQLASDPDAQSVAAEILNAALDPAISLMMDVRRGDLKTGLHAVRRWLAAQDKTLFLLIEDLSVTKGLDAELIEALLPGSVEDRLCDQRCVLGVVSEDFQALRDNLRGRVGLAVRFDAEAALDGCPGESAFDLPMFLDFASRYLNAVRYLPEELQAWARDCELGDVPPTKCRPCKLQTQCHTAFGEVSGRGLFPFNAIALSRLYRRLEQQAAGAFKPRLLISRIMSPMLAYVEDEWERKLFPGRNVRDQFKLAALSAADQQQLKASLKGDEAIRATVAVELYADPVKIDSLSRDIASALGLSFGAISPPPPRKKMGEEPPPPPPSPSPSPPPPEVDVFDQWANGVPIPNQLLNEWRKHLHDAICENWDWDAEPLLVGPIRDYCKPNWIHFDGQRVSDSVGDLRVKVKRTAESAIGMREIVRKPDRELGDPNTWPAYCSAMELTHECIQQVRDGLRKLAKEVKQRSWGWLTHALATDAFLRGQVAENPDDVDLLDAIMFSEDAAMDSGTDELGRHLGNTKNLVDEVRLCLKGALCLRKGQAVGNTINPVPILKSLKAAAREVDLGVWEQLAQAKLFSVLRHASDLASKGRALQAGLNARREASRDAVERVEKYLGDGSFKEAKDILLAALTQAQKASLHMDPQVTEAVKALQDPTESLSRLRLAARAEKITNAVLLSCAKAPTADVDHLLIVLGDADRAIAAIEQRLEDRSPCTASDRQSIENAISKGLESLEGDLNILAGEAR